jgi:hypothetical protein
LTAQLRAQTVITAPRIAVAQMIMDIKNMKPPGNRI